MHENTAENAVSKFNPEVKKTIKKKIRDADPVVRAIMRSLLIRLNDINMKSEDFWRSLNVMTSLSDEKD